MPRILPRGAEAMKRSSAEKLGEIRIGTHDARSKWGWRKRHRVARPIACILVLCVLAMAGVNDALAQARTASGGLLAPREGEIAQVQREFIARLESFATQNAAPNTRAYWAIVTANLGHLARLQQPDGPRALMNEPPRFAVPAEVLQWTDERKREPVVKGDLLQAQLDELKLDVASEAGPRIFGGRRVDPGSFPEVVALATPLCQGKQCAPGQTPQNFHAFCSGTLVAHDAVLTAGHCLCKEIAPSQYVPLRVDEFAVVLGDDVRAARRGMLAFRVRRADQKADSEPRNVDEEEHKQRCTEYHWAGRDLALVRLGAQVDSSAMPGPGPVEKSKLPLPAAIATPQMLFGLNFEPGKGMPLQGLLAGYGYTEQILSWQAKISGQFETGIKYFTRTLVDELVCPSKHASGCAPGRELTAIGEMPALTEQPRARSDTCSGDSGGPFFMIDGQERRYLIGATSRAAGIVQMLAGFWNKHSCGGGGIYSLLNAAAIEWLKANEVEILLCVSPGVCFTPRND